MEPSSSKRQREVDPNENDFYNIGKEIQNRAGQPLGAPGVEDRRFRENFGCGAAVALMLWQMLSTHDLVPPSGQIIHMLWTLYFLKQYPKQDAGCAAAGGSRRAIDPKTFRKYVHPFISAIAELEIYVVSIFVDCCFDFSHLIIFSLLTPYSLMYCCFGRFCWIIVSRAT